MTDTTFALMADDADDLPRTLRREREKREREAGSLTAHGIGTYDEPPYAFQAEAPPPPTTVARLDVPFLHLTAFFIKAVFAAIPALILLGVVLWFAGHLLQTIYPELVKMQILIRFPH